MSDSVFVSGTKVTANPTAFGITVMSDDSDITNDCSIEIVNGQKMLTVPLGVVGRYTPFASIQIWMSTLTKVAMGVELKQHFTETAGELIQQDKDTRYLARPSLEEQLAKATRRKKKKPSSLIDRLVKRI